MPASMDISRRTAVKLGGAAVIAGGLGSTQVAAHPHDDEETEPEAEEEDQDLATFRAAHLSPDAPAVDVWAAGIGILEDVSFKTVSEYFPAVPDTYRLQVAPTGEHPDGAVIDEEVDVPAGDFTIAAIGEVADENQPLEALVLEDDNSEPESDMARIRAVHTAPDAPNVDIVADGDALFEDVAYTGAAYAEVPAGEYDLSVYAAGDRDESVFDVDVSLDAGTVSSAFAVGYLDPDAAPADEPFDIVLTTDLGPEDDIDEDDDVDDAEDEETEN